MNQPYPLEFLFTPGRVTIVIETYSVVRRVYLDASTLPAEPDPSYQGTSTGRWEGDTLVVETKAILPETSPIQGIIGHSDQMKVTERIQLVEPDVLEIATTVEDPGRVPRAAHLDHPLPAPPRLENHGIRLCPEQPRPVG